MVVRLVVFVLSMVVVAGAFAEPTEMRTWTDADGNTVDARAISYDGVWVELEYANGETGEFKASVFCSEDQAFLEQHFRAEEDEGEDEPPEFARSLLESLVSTKDEAALEEMTEEKVDELVAEIRSAIRVPALLLGIGILAVAIGGIWFLVVAFQESVGWGLGCFVPFVPLVFLIVHWRRAKKPFGVQMLGFLIAIGAVVLFVMLVKSRIAAALGA